MRLSESMEDYLRAIYDLEHGADGAVATTVLAERLGVAPASVTGMLKKLHTAGLVAHERYAGVRLTPDGERVAVEVIRHHRLIETYLAEAMGIEWDKVHDEAHRLEHHISAELGERMAEILGHPERDPHGAPIPPKGGPFSEPAYRTLAEAQLGERLVIRQVEDEDPERLRYLAEMGLRPDVVVVVTSVAPFGGPITVSVEGAAGGRTGPAEAERPAPVLGAALAATISVELVDGR